MKLIMLSIFYLVAPYIILLLTKKYKILDRIGAVLLCYALGLIAGLTNILPEGSEKVQDIVTSATIPLALPLLSMVKIEDFINISPALFWFVASVIAGTFIFHVLLSAMFKIDTDTTIITATALICSPPFVPVIAGVLKNKQIIISGLTVGIVGYAIGNYLGILLAAILQGFG
jgi:uncharacterized membrane protein